MKFNLLLAINRLGPSISYNPPPLCIANFIFFLLIYIPIFTVTLIKGCELLLFNKGLG